MFDVEYEDVPECGWTEGLQISIKEDTSDMFGDARSSCSEWLNVTKEDVRNQQERRILLWIRLLK